MKKTMRILAIVLIVATTCGMLSLGASAASSSLPKVSTSTYIKAYPIKASGKISVYTNAALTKRNTSEYIDAASDECWITGFNKTYNSVRVSYPTSDGRKTRYAPASVFFPTGDVSDSFPMLTAPSKLTTYKRSSGSTTYGTIYKGERFYVLGITSSKDRICALYPLDAGGYKIGWIKASALASGTSSGNTSSGSSTSGSSTSGSISNTKSYNCPYCHSYKGTNFLKVYLHALGTGCFKRDPDLCAYWDSAMLLLDLASHLA